MCFSCLYSDVHLCVVRSSHCEVFVKKVFVQVKWNPWKIPVKVFVVTKSVGL